MTIHARKGRSMGWNYAGIGVIVLGLVVAVAVMASGRFEVEFRGVRALMSIAAAGAVLAIVALLVRRGR
jgi:hypothetical protein